MNTNSIRKFNIPECAAISSLLDIHGKNYNTDFLLFLLEYVFQSLLWIIFWFLSFLYSSFSTRVEVLYNCKLSKIQLQCFTTTKKSSKMNLLHTFKSERPIHYISLLVNRKSN